MVKIHLYAITRGIKHEVDRVITELQGKYLPTTFKGEPASIALGVRPIQLWELVFPEEHLQRVMHTIENMNWKRKGILLEALRIALHAKKVPPMDKTTLGMPVYRGQVEFNLLGIRKDKQEDNHERL